MVGFSLLLALGVALQGIAAEPCGGFHALDAGETLVADSETVSLAGQANSPSDCCTECSSDALCKGFTLLSKTCYLKFGNVVQGESTQVGALAYLLSDASPPTPSSPPLSTSPTSQPPPSSPEPCDICDSPPVPPLPPRLPCELCPSRPPAAPPPLSPSPSDDGDSSMPVIIGISVGSVVLVLLCGAGAMWYRKNRRSLPPSITTPRATTSELRGIELRDPRPTSGRGGPGRGKGGTGLGRGGGGRGPSQPSPRTNTTSQPPPRRNSSVEMRPTRDQRPGRGAPVRVDPRLGNVTTEKAKSTAALQGAQGNPVRFNRM